MKKQSNRDKDSDNREKNRSNKHSEDSRGFNYGDDITELKNKLQVECAKTANVSVIELANIYKFTMSLFHITYFLLLYYYNSLIDR